jgi:outer membrane protein TolC
MKGEVNTMFPVVFSRNSFSDIVAAQRMNAGPCGFRMRSGRPGIVPCVLISMVFMVLAPAVSRAAEPDANGITLVEAVRMALRNNHEVLAQREGLLAQEKDVGVARSWLLPRVSFEERYLRTTNPGYAFMSRLNQERITASDFNPDLLNDPDPIGDYQTTLSVEQPIFMRKAMLGLAMSRKEALAKSEDLKRKKEETAFSVTRTYLMVQSAREYAKAMEKGIEEARENERIANVRYRNGVGQYADTLRTATALMEARQRANSAAKNLALAQETLGLLTAAGSPVDAAAEGVDLPVRDQAFYAERSRTRSDVSAASLRTDNARKNVSLAEAAYLPYLGVGGAYQFDDHDTPFGSEGKSWQVSAFLRWDLFDGTKREYERAKAVHLSQQADHSFQAMKQGVAYRIREASLNVDEARRNSELARQALATAEEGTRLLRLRYESGLATLADLLSAQSSLEQARAGVVERENAFRTATASLSFEGGSILEDLGVGE